jgi:hypothetical protein
MKAGVLEHVPYWLMSTSAATAIAVLRYLVHNRIY